MTTRDESVAEAKAQVETDFDEDSAYDAHVDQLDQKGITHEDYVERFIKTDKPIPTGTLYDLKTPLTVRRPNITGVALIEKLKLDGFEVWGVYESASTGALFLAIIDRDLVDQLRQVVSIINHANRDGFYTTPVSKEVTSETSKVVD